MPVGPLGGRETVRGSAPPGRWPGFRGLASVGGVAGAVLAAAAILKGTAPPFDGLLAALGAITAGSAIAVFGRRSSSSSLERMPSGDSVPRHGPTLPTGAPRQSGYLRSTMWTSAVPIRTRSDHANGFSASGTSTADSIWEAWEPTLGELPGPLIGPSPETFVPIEPTFGTGVFDVGVPTFVLPAISVNPPTPTPSAAVSASRSVGADDLAFTDIELEALTPIPPHLRIMELPSILAPATAEGPIVGTVAPERSRCATCRRTVSGNPTWRRCPECHGALCAACSVTALKTQARAWCACCAALYVGG